MKRTTRPNVAWVSSNSPVGGLARAPDLALARDSGVRRLGFAVPYWAATTRRLVRAVTATAAVQTTLVVPVHAPTAMRYRRQVTRGRPAHGQRRSERKAHGVAIVGVAHSSV